MGFYSGPRAMNVGGMDLLNFLDIRDKDDRMSTYDDKEGKQQTESCCGDGDDLGLSRKESRIPVAVKRLRSRSERNDSSSFIPRNESNEKLEDWQFPWNNQADKEMECNKKLMRLQARKHMADPLSLESLDIHGNGHSKNMLKRSNQLTTAPQFTCAKCGRSCMMINRDGVYVAFSVGVTPLLLLCLFVICVVLGWLGLNYGFSPSVFHRLQLPVPPRQKSRGGWFGRYFIK